MKKLLLILFFLLAPLHASFGQAGVTMNATLDRFYIQYHHPLIKEGANLLGTVVLANNNPDGFHLKLISSNGGVLKSTTYLDGETDINYNVTFTEGSGSVGTGVVIDYTAAELLTNHFIYQTTNQTSATDIALKLHLHIDQAINPLIMAGTYRDEIQVEYINVNAI